MKTELIHTLTATFEGNAQQTESGVEYWLARDLQHLLGYSKWDNFLGVLAKAKTACEVSGHEVADHFADVGKMVDRGSDSQREIEDIMLTRYVCFLIAQNGDPRKASMRRNWSKPSPRILLYFISTHSGKHVDVFASNRHVPVRRR